MERYLSAVIKKIVRPYLLFTSSLRWQLLLALGFVAAITLGAAGAAAYLSERAALETQLYAQLTAVADLKQKQLTAWLNERRADARLLAVNRLNQEHFTELLTPEIPAARKTEFAAFLADNLVGLQQSRIGYSNIAMADSQGRVLVATDPTLVGQSVAQEPAFRQTLAAPQGEFIQDIHRNPHSGLIEMNFGHALHAIDLRTHQELDEVIGVVLVSVEMDKTVFALLQDWTGLGQTGEILLVRAEGDQTLFLNSLRFNSSPPLQLRLPATAPQARPAHLAARNARGITQAADYRDMPVLAAFRPIPEPGWGFVVKQDLDEALAPVAALTRRLVWIALGALALAGVVSLVMAQTLTRPLAHLVQASRAVAAGNLKTELPIRRADEIGLLADSFQTMMMALQRRQEEVEAAQQSIRRRSAELSALHTLSLFVNSSLEPDQVQRIAVDQTVQLLNATAVAIFSTDENSPVPRLGALKSQYWPVTDEQLLTMANQLATILQETGEPSRILYLSQLTRFDTLPGFVRLEQAGITTVGLVKLAHGNEILGMLAVFWTNAEVSAPEMQLAQTVGQIISPALAHAQSFYLTYEQLQQTNQRLILVNQISRQLSAILDADQLLAEVAQLLQSQAGFEHVGVGLVKGDELVFRAIVVGNQCFLPEFRLKMAEPSLAGWVVTHGEALLVTDTQQSELHYLHPALAEMRSELAAPIRLAGQTMGVLLVAARQPAALSEADQTLLQAVADQLALALNNARSYSQTETALRESEERLRRIYNAAHAAILLIDPERQRLVETNPKARQMLGYSPADLSGLPLAQILPELAALLPNLWPQILQNGSSQTQAFACLTVTGQSIPVEASLSPVQIKGRHYLLAMMIDVTERKKLEEQLRQSQKMEAVGQLAGGVAHDFNNLLTVITGYSDLLLLSIEQEKQRQDIEQIKKAARQAASLTRQLLAFSRKQVLQPQVLDLNQVVADMEKMLRRLIGEDIELVTAFEPALGRVKADPGQVEQVLMNLVVNARDAMPGGGQILIETANIVLDESYTQYQADLKAGPYALLAVTDTGVGMDAATRSHIFEPFFTTKGPDQGTGLGLATVYGIIKQSGGHIAVYSEPGQGTTFKIYLPHIQSLNDVHSSDRPETGVVPGGSETILLVEDQAEVRDLAARVLQQQEYNLLVAAHPDEALVLSEQTPIDLLITDVILPQMNGRDLADRLIQAHPEMKALYISGYTDKAMAQHGVLETGTNFLQKPFSPAALSRKVRAVLDEKEPQPVTE